MHIALVHELLTIRGGAENVLRVLGDMFPNAPIYTLLYDEEKLGAWFPRARVHTSSLQAYTSFLPRSLRFNHHLYLRQFPKAVEAWHFDDFDVVLSTSSAFAHGIITNGKPKHLSYIHSPARYLWDQTREVTERAGHGILGPLRRSYMHRTFHWLRTWDAEAADRPDKLIAPSETVRRRIELFWRRESTVIPPPIDDLWLHAPLSRPNGEAGRYFFLASTLATYKRIDLAIEAARMLRVPLKIAGEGPDLARLQSIAGSTVEFLGYRTHEELRQLYSGAIATIFPGDEDFGLVPLESLACGTPVVAFRSGGATETLDEHVAEFFEHATVQALASAMQRMAQRTIDPELCRMKASPHNRTRFCSSIQAEIESLMCQN